MRLPCLRCKNRFPPSRGPPRQSPLRTSRGHRLLCRARLGVRFRSRRSHGRGQGRHWSPKIRRGGGIPLQHTSDSLQPVAWSPSGALVVKQGSPICITTKARGFQTASPKPAIGEKMNADPKMLKNIWHRHGRELKEAFWSPLLLS